MGNKHRHQSTEPETTPDAEAGAAASADLKPTADGQSDPAAQAKISTQGGLRAGGGDLVAELGALPAIGALDGIRANAQTGYYKTVPAAQLVADLEGLTFETDDQTAVRDALIERAKSGTFSGA
jgi:hypothetical protein